MLDAYKYLLGKKEQINKKGIFDFLTKPYRMLFKNSDESPKIAGSAPEIEKPNDKAAEKPAENHQKITSVKLEDGPKGKVLWKKK